MARRAGDVGLDGTLMRRYQGGTNGVARTACAIGLVVVGVTVLTGHDVRRRLQADGSCMAVDARYVRVGVVPEGDVPRAPRGPGRSP